MIVLLYVDHMIIVSKKEKEIYGIIKSLKEKDERFILTLEGDIKNCLGVEIVKINNSLFEFKQPHLTQRTLDYVKIKKHANRGKHTPVTPPLYFTRV